MNRIQRIVFELTSMPLMLSCDFLSILDGMTRPTNILEFRFELQSIVLLPV